MPRPRPVRCAWRTVKTVLPPPSLRLITAGEKSKTFSDVKANPPISDCQRIASFTNADNKESTRRDAIVQDIKVQVGIGHEACNKTIDDLLQLVAAQRALLESTTASLNAANQTIAALNSLIALMPATKTTKRGRGRPTKHTDDSSLVEIFNNIMLPEFIAANRNAKATDAAVLTWYFTKEYSRYGRSASRVRGKEFQGKLKTLKNRLGNARDRLYKTSH